MDNCSRQTEVKFAIDSCYLKNLKKRLGIHSSTELTRSAMTLLDWVSGEINEGRVILTTDANGGQIHRLEMPELTKSTNQTV